jgi:hypothetical protein
MVRVTNIYAPFLALASENEKPWDFSNKSTPKNAE